MEWIIKLFAGPLLSGIAAILTPIFGFLNKRVDADVQKHVVDTKAIEGIAGNGLDALAKADALKADIRKSEGSWGPSVIMMFLVLGPFVWHEWQVVMDSCRWVPVVTWAWDWLPFPWVTEHRIGSWGVAKLGAPEADGSSIWDKTEQAIFQSLFIGATAGIATVAAIKAIKR